jgi:hypothetical protein
VVTARIERTRAKAAGRQPRLPIKQTAIDILQAWSDVDEEAAEEQRATGEYLIKAIDEHRLPGAKLFQ